MIVAHVVGAAFRSAVVTGTLRAARTVGRVAMVELIRSVLVPVDRMTLPAESNRD